MDGFSEVTDTNVGSSAMKTNERSERVRADVISVLRGSVHDKTFPGAVAALISRDDEAYIAYGFETYDPAAYHITEDSIFDVASLTKVVATATAIMQLVERKQLSLQDLACDFFPQLRQVSVIKAFETASSAN
jgi:CubicO group peptidase (beta-lactamase class C family)